VSVNAWLILAQTRTVRGDSLKALLDRFETAENIVGASTADLHSAGLTKATIRDLKNPDERKLELCHRWASADDHHAVPWTDGHYPVLLRELSDAPPLLFVRGNIDALSLPQFAIVGSRNCTAGGRDTARRFASHLSRSGFCITSGLALGIDAAAHQGALDTGQHTVAVLGTGPDQVYPQRHDAMANEITVNGALVSEFPPGSPPRREQFPQRNRLISGLAVGTLVVEASLRSGALITAGFAAEQGREVFAIPGSIHNPTARGCHRLIRLGAKLVESADDIIEELPGILAGLTMADEQSQGIIEKPVSPGFDADYQHLLEFMGWDPVTVDTLVSRSGLTAEEVSSMLLILELDGHIEPLAGGRYLQREEGRSK